MLAEDNSPLLRQIALVALLGGLVLLSYSVLKPFLVPVIWALILAYVTWPLYERLRRGVRERVTLAQLPDHRPALDPLPRRHAPLFSARRRTKHVALRRDTAPADARDRTGDACRRRGDAYDSELDVVASEDNE